MSDFELHIENVWTYIKSNRKEINPNLLRRIEEETSYTVEQYSRFAKTKTVEIGISLFEREQLRYPTGLYSTIDNIFSSCGYDFDVIDHRDRPQVQPQQQFLRKLRDYQQETVEKAIKAERGVIKIATGGGKTVIGAAIIASLNLRTVFIVHSIDLLEQTADEFEKMFGIEVGKIGGGFCEIKKINVCTVQTLHSAFGIKYVCEEELFIKEKISKEVLERKEEIREVVENSEVVMVDEGHKLPAATYIQVMKLLQKAMFRFILSATPYRDSSIDRVLDGYTGKLIINLNASYLIERGFLVAPTIYILDPNEHQKYKFIRQTYKTVYDHWIVNNKDRNQMIVDCVMRLSDMDKSTLITVTRITHGENLCEMLDKAGVKSFEFIRGEVDKVTRKRLLNDVREKKLKVLLGTSVTDEGVDIPALDAAILAGGGRSLIKSLQRIGRTLRPYPNAEENIKKEAIIVDFYDRVRYLTGHSTKRMKIYGLEPKFKLLKHF